MKIETFQGITIAYMRRIGAYGPENRQLMEKLKAFLAQHDLLKSTILGIPLDDPTITPAEKLRYDVGLIVPANATIPLPTRNIDDGTYAVFEVQHTQQGVSSFWQNIGQLTLSIDNTKPIIERYSSQKIVEHLCEFCIPIIR
ncbi:MAG: DNA gyrase inhibitory protein [Lawsonibacter sp.]|nr:DNA gyrase inhibitory protein [Lawsonibacter sp.]